MKPLYLSKSAKPNLQFKIIFSILGELSSNLLCFFTLILFLSKAEAQIIPDATLPVNSIVTPQGNINLIEGGTQTGNNLFHSFREFSIPTGTEAFFNNNLQIKNIFTRVTGNSISNIDGLIRSNGTANFFLINPNGIIFGYNAKLNIGGSFLATTANSIKFSNGEEFSARNTQTVPLLTVSIPIGLQYGNTGAGEIRIAGKGQDLYNQELGTTNNFDASLNPLEIASGNTLAFIGGNIIIDGGIIQASSSRIELGGLAGEGTVDINPDGTFTFPDISRSDISIINKAGINVVSPNGGNININARNLEISGESFISGGIPTDKGTLDTIAGDISLNATGAIAISASRIENSVNSGAIGKSGNINITANSLTLSQGALFDASIFGQGSGGNITIIANDSVSFAGVNNQSVGGIQTTVGKNAKGDAGNISITAKFLRISEGASINTSTFNQGKAGNVNIIASDTVLLDGTQNSQTSSTITSSVDVNAVGDAGTITINTGSLILTNGGTINVTTNGNGDAGDITIIASDTISFDGEGENNPGGVNSSVGKTGIGDGGDIKIITKSLSATNGAGLTTNTFGIGNAGSINIVASDSVFLDNQVNDGLRSGALSTVGDTGIGNAGSINITSKYVNISNNALLESNSVGTGAAGNIVVEANIINLNNQAQISTDSLGGVTPTTKDQANIKLQTESLILQNNSIISTNAKGNKIVGGNIIINTDTLAALGNSDISANSLNDRGGNVTINSQGIFGAQSLTTEELEVLLNTKDTNQLNPKLLSTSDITATGADPSLSGTVSINTPNINPSAGLVELTGNPIDSTTMITSTCQHTTETNKFFVSGKGGLPPSPDELLINEAIWIDLRGNGESGVGNGRVRKEETGKYLNSRPSSIIEAQGWQMNAQGEVVLVVEAPIITMHNSALTSPQCPSAPASSVSVN